MRNSNGERRPHTGLDLDGLGHSSSMKHLASKVLILNLKHIDDFVRLGRRSLHIVSLSKESNAFSKSTNSKYRGDDHSIDCSTIILKVAI